MTARSGKTFRRYTLLLELSGLALASAILFVAVWFTLAEMNQAYLNVRLADAAKVHLFLKNNLDAARGALATFAELPEAERSATVLTLFPAFSDIYLLDQRLHVTKIYKASPSNKVFTGFSFSGGKLGDYLKSASVGKALSEFMRGYEDDAPSVYFAIPSQGSLLLGRLDLAYAQNFLAQFSRFSGTPALLITKDGFVMLASDPALQISAFDLRKWTGPPVAGRTLLAGQRRWIPKIAQMQDVGGMIVTLTPTELLDSQRNALLTFSLMFMAVMIIQVVIRHRRITRLIVQPIAAFAERMRDPESGRQPSADTGGTHQFEELAGIQSRILAVMTRVEQSEAKFRCIFEQSPLGIALIDAESGRLLELNERLTQIIGRSREELVTIGWVGATDPADLPVELDQVARMRAGEITGFQLEKRYLRADGATVWGSLTVATVTPGADGHPLHLVLVEDTTARKRYEDELREARDAAQSANRAKSEFLANMSHEIRTPLNAILGFAQVLGRAPGLNAGQRDSLAIIERSGERLLALINDILDMAKIEAGRMAIQATPFDPRLLVKEVEAYSRQRAQERGLVLSVEGSWRPGMVVGDATKLRQVLINLVGNAVKFTANGSVTLRVAPLDNAAIQFSVSDTGMGIAPEEMARLFEPFGQTASGRQVQGGTGLGLALSSRFVRLMGGELAAQSTPGQGSCFSFTLSLPATAAVAPAVARSEVPVVGLVPGQPVCRILIVDDLPNNRAPLRALLAGLNPQPPVLEFREAVDGREAVVLWDEWQPHVVFMDMQMPVLSGEEATRQIKALMAARPAAVRSVVVALTASVFDENRDRFLADGCDDFARKPFQAEELFSILERRAGLRFVRALPGLATAAPLSPQELATRLAACPVGWRAELKGAAELGDFGRITDLLGQLHHWDPALHEALDAWAYDYDLDAFARAIAAIEK